MFWPCDLWLFGVVFGALIVLRLIIMAVQFSKPFSSHQIAIPTNAPMVSVADVPTITTEEATTITNVLDIASLQANHPIPVDADNDGTNDTIMLIQEGGVYNAFFSKGLGQGQFAPRSHILTIRGKLIGYTVFISNHKELTIGFWDEQRQGYIRRCIGLINGQPYFGAIEKN